MEGLIIDLHHWPATLQLHIADVPHARNALYLSHTTARLAQCRHVMVRV
jgi:hypothetical protein